MDLPLWVWVVAVLLIDVGHVWSSIYRTYLDPVTRRTSPDLLRWVPALCFVPCLFLAIVSDELFWRVLAYVAAFHFVKQQVGITALYRARQLQQLGFRRDNPQPWIATMTRLDKLAAYAATVCPLLWWHANLPRNFSWFIPGDFIDAVGLRAWLSANPMIGQGVSLLFYGAWVGILVAWLGYHIYLMRTHNIPLQLGKLLWVFGTAINWYLGLVYFDSDLVFTITNVVAHGIPYYGLMALHGSRRLADTNPRLGKHPRVWAGVFVLPILLLAFFEEYLWDLLLYRDHTAFFAALLPYTESETTGHYTKALYIALLSLPQTVHYVLDGFIWKGGPRNPDLGRYLFPPPRNEVSHATES
ncbi:MAG: hypothetical protein QNK37_34560 [Acidobacteriota bacterium]|nr:hypothetical protein [Acidobacteriota bacterium]